MSDWYQIDASIEDKIANGENTKALEMMFDMIKKQDAKIDILKFLIDKLIRDQWNELKNESQ